MRGGGERKEVRIRKDERIERRRGESGEGKKRQ